MIRMKVYGFLCSDLKLETLVKIIAFIVVLFFKHSKDIKFFYIPIAINQNVFIFSLLNKFIAIPLFQTNGGTVGRNPLIY